MAGCGRRPPLGQAGLPAPSASVNFLVPDCAILPRLFFRSALLIPIPLSSIVSVLASCRARNVLRSGCKPLTWVRLARRTLSATMRTRPSKLVVLSSVSERKRFLSHASAAFEISSRRKMSCTKGQRG